MTNTTEQWYDKTWLVALLCIVFFPVGLYALWKSAKYSQGWKIVGTAIIGFLVIIAASDKSQATKASKATTASTTEAKPAESPVPEEKPAPVEETKKEDLSLFQTTDDFKDAFNKFCSTNDFDLSVDDLTVKEGKVQNSFQYMFNENLGILGSIDKDNGKVTEIMMMGSSDGTAKSGVNILTCIAAIIGAVDPTLEAGERGDILKELHLIGDKKVNFADLSKKTTKNGIKYFVSSSKIMGFMFGASRK